MDRLLRIALFALALELCVLAVVAVLTVRGGADAPGSTASAPGSTSVMVGCRLGDACETAPPAAVEMQGSLRPAQDASASTPGY